MSSFQAKLLDADALVAAIARGVESDVGDAFFDALVASLARVLGVKYAFVSELTHDGTHFRTLAFWERGRIASGFEVPIAGTPCEAVLEGECICHPESLQERFPADHVLVDWAAQSYAGVPLLDSTGAVLGHLAFVHDEPWGEAELAISLMRIFAKRTAAEIERRRVDLERRRAEEQLARIVESASDAIICFDESGTIRLFNGGAERLLRCSAAQALGEPIARFTTGEGARALAASQRALAARPGTRLFVGEAEHLRAKRADGTTFPFDSSLSCSASADGLLYTLILRDLEGLREEQRELALLRLHNQQLQEELADRQPSAEIVGRSRSLEKLLEQVQLVAPTDASVLIRGETGTGKELVAHALHAHSRRADQPLIKVNCAAIPAGLLESELFGHERGAFTGATARRIGRFELANGGTIFLDEIGELSFEAQAKLLRILQEREFERVGSSVTLQSDARILAATNRDLEKAVAEGSFREDLYYRLNVFPIRLPPLRERADDIPLLSAFFLSRHAVRMGRRAERVSAAGLARLLAYPWPGNVRELENVIERALILCPAGQAEISGETIERVLGQAGPAAARTLRSAGRDAPAPQAFAHDEPGTLEELERRHIAQVLAAAGGRLEGPAGAAQILGLAPSSLRARMKRLGIARPGPDAATADGGSPDSEA